MGDYVRVSVHVEPVEELATENGGAEDVLASEVGKTLGGESTPDVTDYSGTDSVQGQKDGAPYYKEIIDSADTTALSTETTASCIVIRNTGYTYSSSSALGAALDKTIKVMAGDNDKEPIAYLEPGACISLPCGSGALLDASAIYLRTVDNDGGENASAGHLAGEFLVVD